MVRSPLTGTVATLTLAVCAPAVAQVQISSGAARLGISGRLHMQFNTSSVDGEESSAFLLRRARLTIDAALDEFLSGRIEPEFGLTSVHVRDAYVRLTFDPAFRITAGQFKRPFDLFELTSSNDILVIERTGAIRGATGCAGVDLCSYSSFTEALQFADRDVGVQVDGRAGRVTYAAAVTNGAGLGTAEENSTKSYSARFTVEAAERLRLGANVGVHDFPNQVTGEDDYARALGADIEIGAFERGFHVQAGVTAGENWRNLDGAGDASSFVTAQGILSYRIPVPGEGRVRGVEPIARLSWGDGDTERGGDAHALLTPGVILHFVGRSRFALNLDVLIPQTGTAELSLKGQLNLHF